MKLAIVGSRDIKIRNLNKYIPDNVTEIVSGGARGVDTCAKEYANKNHIKLTEFLPEYNKFGKAAPLKRNQKIIDYADEIIAFWDGNSHGTKYTIDKCHVSKKKVTVYIIKPSPKN